MGHPPRELSPRQRIRAARRRRSDALMLVAERALAAGFGAEDGAPISGSRAERYQVFLFLDTVPPALRRCGTGAVCSRAAGSASARPITSCPGPRAGRRAWRTCCSSAADHRRRGIDPGPWTPSVRWRHELDVPPEVWLAATEAGLAGADRRLAAEEAEAAEE